MGKSVLWSFCVIFIWFNISFAAFTDNGNGTVTDTSTGLIWQRKAAEMKTWQDAISYCEALTTAGFTDWRLPDINELQSLVDYEKSNPAIDTEAFPEDTPSGFYWSSTSYGATSVWGVDFSYGYVSSNAKTGIYYVRAVRGGKADIYYHTAVTYTDPSTGLMWQIDTAASMTWQDALVYCENLNLGDYSDWRLPDINELQSLVNYKESNPAIDTIAFPGTTKSGFYWSSTSYGATSAWGVDFSYGYVSSNAKTGIYYVRAVRGGKADLIKTATVSGRVFLGYTNTPLEGIEVSLGGKTVTTDSKGKYTIIDANLSQDNTLRTSSSGMTSFKKTVEPPDGAVQMVMDDIRLFYPSGGKPIVTDVNTEKDGIFLSGLSINNEITADVDWMGAEPGVIQFFANGVKITEVSGTNASYSCKFDMAGYFIPAFSRTANYVTVKAVTAAGIESETTKKYFTVIPLPDPIKLVLPDSDTVYLLFDKGIGVDFEFPPTPLSHKIDLPVVGKFGVEFNVCASFDYTFGDSAWEAAIGVGAEGKQGKRGNRPKFPFITRHPSIKLYIGNKEISGKIEAGARGVATWTNGITFDEIFGHGEIKAKLELTRYGLLDLLGPGLSNVVKPIPGLGDIVKNVSIIIWAIPGIEGDLVFALKPEFDFKGFELTGKIGLEASYEPDLKICKARIYVGGEPSVTFGYPGDLFKRIRFKAYAGAEFSAWFITIRPSEFVFVDVTYPSGARSLNSYEDGEGRKTVIAVPVTSEDSTLHPLDRSYLSAGPERFVAPKHPTRQAKVRQANTPLIENVFPTSSPSLTSNAQDMMLVYVKDNGSSNDLQFTDISFTRFDGANWSTPASIATDTRGEFSPQVQFDSSGDAVAVWERIEDPDFNTLDITAMAAQMEIVWSRWDKAANTWSAPQPLTSNTHLDFHAQLSGLMSDGSLLVTWTRNTANLLMGDSASPSQVMWAKWNPQTKSWSAPEVLIDTLSYSLSETLAGSGNKAVFAWTKDSDGSLETETDQEIFYRLYSNGVWGQVTQFTSDSLADKNIRAAVSSQGDVYLVWRQADSLVMSKNFGAASVVRPNSGSAGFSDFALTLGAAGNLVLIWQEMSEDGPDAFISVYDPASQTWSRDERLFKDSSLERSFAPVWDNAGALTIAYNKVEITKTDKTVTLASGETVTVTGVPQPGRVDLAVVRRALVKDVTIVQADFTVEGENYLPNALLTLSAKVANTGDMAVNNLTVGFYDGNSASGGTLIEQKMLPGWLEGHSSATVSAEWVIPEPASEHMLYVLVDPDNEISEFSETDNTAYKHIGGTDLEVTYLSSTTGADGSLRVRAQVRNIGTSPIPQSTLGLVKSGETENLAAVSVPELASGRLAQVELEVLSIPQGDTFYTLTLEGLAGDVDITNNQANFGVTYIARQREFRATRTTAERRISETCWRCCRCSPDSDCRHSI